MKSTEKDQAQPKPTPLRCLFGAIISAVLSLGLYRLTYAIAVSFATKPIISNNQLTQRIAAAVRTLVLGVASLGTFVFGFVALGLILLAMQLTVQALRENNLS